MSRFQVQRKWGARAFSLVEVSLAMAIVAVAAVTLISALNQSMRTRNHTVILEAGTRIEPFVRSKLNEMNFATLYSFLRERDESEAYHVYSYSSQLDPRRADDDTPIPSGGGDSVVALGFRKSDDELLKADLEFRVGEAFKMRLTPFSFDSAQINVALPDDPSDLEGSAFPIFVEIYQDPTPGENVEEWVKDRRQLSFPVLISRM